MKITFVLPSIGVAGGMRVVFEYANRLKQRGHEVSIIYPMIPLNFGGKWYSLSNRVGQAKSFVGSLMRGNKVDWFNVDAKLVRILTLSPRFIPLFATKIPDADIVVATAWETAYAVSKLGKEKGGKFYFIQHYEIWDVWDEDECWEEAERLESEPTKQCIAMSEIDATKFPFHHFKTLVDESYKLPLRKVTISTWLTNLMEEKFGEQVEAMIMNGVNLELFHNENKQYNEKKRVLMLYHGSRWKGIDDGIRAFEIARERHPEIQLVMFGAHRGADIPHYVEFHERLFGEKLRRLYCSCDIFVCPSWVEGSQAPPMEAMACKCAVVSADVGGIPDYAIPGETALVSPPRCPELLAENLIKLVEDEELLKRISEAGYNHITNLTWDKATEALEQTFSKALGERAR